MNERITHFDPLPLVAPAWAKCLLYLGVMRANGIELGPMRLKSVQHAVEKLRRKIKATLRENR